MRDIDSYREGLMLKKNTLVTTDYAPILSVDNYITLVKALREAKNRYSIDFRKLGEDIEFVLSNTTSDYNMDCLEVLKKLRIFMGMFMKAEVAISPLQLAEFISNKVGRGNDFDNNLRSLAVMKALNITHLAVMNSENYNKDTYEVPHINSHIDESPEYSEMFGCGDRIESVITDRYSRSRKVVSYKDADWTLRIHDKILKPSSEEISNSRFLSNYVLLSQCLGEECRSELYGRRVLTISSPYMFPCDLDTIMRSSSFPNYMEINRLLKCFRAEHNIKGPVKRKISHIKLNNAQ